MREQAFQIGRFQSDATLSRSIPATRYMHENRAAATLHSRRGVEIQHDKDVVKVVLAPKALRARAIRKPDASIVIAITDSVAPTLVVAHSPYR